MSENNENKLVPKLRFPNYSENWTVLPVSEMFEVFRGSPLSKIDLEENGTEPCIHYGELFTKYNEVILATYSKTNRKNGFRSVVGDVLMPSSDVTLTGLAKASAIMLDNVILGGDMNILRPQTDINSIFLSYLLNRSKREIIKLVSGTTVKHIYPSQIITCRLPIIKNSDEQQKIAACLSSLDEVIAGESQKLELLKEHKKGLLQNLFPQEGETVPKLRFKEFEDSGEWEEKSLIQVVNYENGKAHEQDIVESGNYIVVNSKFISSDGEVKKFTNTAFCPAQKGDILMVLSDVPNGKAIAKCFLVEEEDRFTVNQRVCRITPHEINSKILFYLLNRNPYFLAFDDGVKQTNLRKEDVLNCPLLIPSDPKEQQKIADTLSSLDDLINAQSQKIEALKLHKKGLLQGLFPDINEHNG